MFAPPPLAIGDFTMRLTGFSFAERIVPRHGYLSFGRFLAGSVYLFALRVFAVKKTFLQ